MISPWSKTGTLRIDMRHGVNQFQTNNNNSKSLHERSLTALAVESAKIRG